MQKVIVLVLILAFSGVTLACPKGEHPYGGTGKHHKGGYCAKRSR